jgi:hypothetical protein
MTMTRLHLTALLLLALVAGGACQKKSTSSETPSQSGPATAPSPEQYHQAAGGPISAPPTKIFKGSIGTTLDLQMKLTRNGDELAGSYFYQKVGSRIDLKGTIDKDSNVTLEEIGAGGKQTGLFKGNWTIDKEDGLATIAGSWSKPNGEKKTAFSLHEEPIELTGGVELTAKQLKESNKKLHYEIQVAYPQVTGMPDVRFDQFNQEVKNLVNKQVSALKKESADGAREAANEPAPSPGAGEEEKISFPANSLDISYSIALAKDDLISVQFDLSSYSSGAAHPNSYSQVLNYDLKAGKVLKLGDLFNPGAKYIQLISDYCIKDLKRRSKGKDSMLDDQTIQTGAGPSAQNYGSWTITKKGLEITFDPYQVAAYAAGPQTVLVPYSVLKDLIRPDGPLGSLAPFVR